MADPADGPADREERQTRAGGRPSTRDTAPSAKSSLGSSPVNDAVTRSNSRTNRSSGDREALGEHLEQRGRARVALSIEWMPEAVDSAPLT